MYQSIYEFGLKNNIKSELNRKEMRVSAYIPLNNGVLQPIEIIDKKSRKKMCPHLGSMLFSKNQGNFLVDKTEAVLNPESPKHESYVSLISEASKEASSLIPVVSFLKNIDENPEAREDIFKFLDENKIKREENISFKIDGTPVEELSDWDDWLTGFIDSKNSDKTQKKIMSSITGKETTITPESPYPLINAPQAGTGAYISSFKYNSFCSYGLNNNENAAIGDKEARVITDTLNYLLKSETHNDQNFEVLHWYSEEVPEDIITPVLERRAASEEEEKDLALQKLLKSVEDKTINLEFTDADYNFIFYRFCNGRFVAKSKKEGSYIALYRSFIDWMKDSELVSSYYDNDAKRWIRTNKTITNVYPVMFSLINNQEATNKLKQFNAEFGDSKIHIIKAMFEGEQIPKSFFNRAISNVIKSEIKKGNLNCTCLQIIKIYLNRNKEGEEIMPELNENSSNTAYNMGRMLAIYENIQKAASGNLNSNLIDKYFISAIKRPLYTFTTLSTLAEKHLKKLSANDKIGLKNHLKKMLTDVAAKIEGEIPERFTKEEQGRFILGYYHQYNAFFSTNKENKEDN